MQPLFCPGSVGPLYGCYHSPSGRSRNTGVVLANAHGHEYIQFHRVFLALARMLAQAGFPVLRFDYTGCGDSAGSSMSWSLDGWHQDLDLAIEELQRRAGVPHVGVVGLRLGGTLACREPGLRTAPRFMVLWDAVVSGRTYLQEMRDAHQSMLRYAHVLPAEDAWDGEELLGFPVPNSWAGEVDALALGTLRRAPAPRVLLIESNAHHTQSALQKALEGFDGFRYLSFSNPHLWSWTEDFTRVHVPIEILQTIVNEVREGASS